MNKKQINIYKDYIQAQTDGKMTATEVAKKHGVTQSYLYQIVKKVEEGDCSKMDA